MNQQLIPRTMTHEEWFTVPDCPIQRDTKRHADKASKSHLKEQSSAQLIVHMATLPDGRCFKIDGHTRSLLWEDGRLPVPELLHVMVHPCQSLQEVLHLYTHFDGQGQAEDAPDKVYGAFRFHKISPNSSLIKKCRLAMVMRALPYPGNNTYDAVSCWKKEIIAFDNTGPVPGTHFPSGVLAGALATFRRHPKAAIAFWTNYQNDQGVKSGKERDGVQALREFVQRRRKTTGRDCASNIYDLACRVISTFESWRSKRYYKSNHIKRTDLREYIGKNTKTTQIHSVFQTGG
jgi:hypothetical protein